MGRSWRWFPISVALAAGCVGAPAADQTGAVGAARPNILLILIDDLGFEAIGAYGGASYETPNIDRLAAEGVRFTHAYAMPLCSPSRLKLMTGRYNSRNYTEWGVLPPEEVTFANVLQDAGYAAFLAGKWQLSGFEQAWAPEKGCCKGLRANAGGGRFRRLPGLALPREGGPLRRSTALAGRRGRSDLRGRIRPGPVRRLPGRQDRGAGRRAR